MAIEIYYHERCGDCGDIRDALKGYDVQYQGHYWPPSESDIDALSGNLPEPVLVHEELAPDGIVGHEEILKWIEEKYGEE